MRKDALLPDGTAATSILEFVLTFILAAGIFTMFLMNFNSMFVNQPKYVVTTNQFVDIGNDVTTKIIDTYLVAPDDGIVVTYFDIPDTVAGSTYEVSIHALGGNFIDREVQVRSVDFGPISVNTTLNGAYTTIKMNGTTRSTSPLHGIVYQSPK